MLGDGQYFPGSHWVQESRDGNCQPSLKYSGEYVCTGQGIGTKNIVEDMFDELRNIWIHFPGKIVILLKQDPGFYFNTSLYM